MAFLTDTTRPENTGLTGWVDGLLADLKLRNERQRVYRETFTELSKMNDRELEDIGISRVMIRDIAREASSRV